MDELVSNQIVLERFNIRNRLFKILVQDNMQYVKGIVSMQEGKSGSQAKAMW